MIPWPTGWSARKRAWALAGFRNFRGFLLIPINSARDHGEEEAHGDRNDQGRFRAFWSAVS